MSRGLRVVGVVLVVAAVLLLAVPTGSFSTVAGDRGANVGIGSDEDALLALQGTGLTVTNPGNPTPVGELHNGLAAEMTVEYQASVDAAAVGLENPSGTLTIPSDGTATLQATCQPPDGGSGTATLTVDIVEAVAGNTTIRGASLQVAVQYDCPGQPGGGGPPGDGVAWDDANRNGEYDEGERVISESEIPTLDNASVDLVVGSDAGTVDAKNQQIDIKARSVTLHGSTLASNRQISVQTTAGDVELVDAAIDAKNGKVELKAGSITAEGSTIASNRQIQLEAESGPVDLSGSTVDAKNGKIELKGASVDVGTSTLSSNRQIKLEAESGPVSLADAEVDAKNGKIELKGHGVAAAGASLSSNKEIKVEAESGTLALTDATVDAKNGKVELKGPVVDASGATVTSNKEIKVTAESGGVDLRGATVDSANGKIEVKSNAELLASDATFDTNTDISLTSSGDMDLGSARVTTHNGQATATLNTASAVLTVEGAVIADRDDTLAYSPSGATVSGTPAQGTVG